MPLSVLLQIGLLAAPIWAGPVVCTTTLEAPDAEADGAAPVQLTRCEPVETTSELLERRYSTWSAPFDSGVNMLHQLTDLLGIAVGGPDGTHLMGFGFPDQTVIWDGTVMRNTIDALMEEQSPHPLAFDGYPQWIRWQPHPADHAEQQVSSSCSAFVVTLMGSSCLRIDGVGV